MYGADPLNFALSSLRKEIITSATSSLEQNASGVLSFVTYPASKKNKIVSSEVQGINDLSAQIVNSSCFL